MNDRPVYGLTKHISSYKPLQIAFHEWIAMWQDMRLAPTMRERLATVFGRLGRKI